MPTVHRKSNNSEYSEFMQRAECEGCVSVKKNTTRNPHEGDEQTCRGINSKIVACTGWITSIDIDHYN